MFYCDPCAEKYEWPKTIFAKSQGKCEMCDKVAICNDVPSSALPFANRAKLTEVKAGSEPVDDLAVETGARLIFGEGRLDPDWAAKLGVNTATVMIQQPPCGAPAPCVLNAQAIASCRLDKGHDEGPDATKHEFVLKW